MQKTFTTLKPYQEYIALFAIILIWFFLLILSGAYKSGFHLMDDGVLMELANSLTHNSYWEVLEQNLHQDFQIRFRPFYWVDHLLLVQLFKTNWTYWGLHHFVIAVLTSFFLFKIVRFFRLDVIISVFFVILVLVGEQTEIFYRSSPAERSGLFYLVLGVYIWLVSQNQLLKGVGIIFIVLSTLSKESFIFVIPFLLGGLYLLDFTAISLPNLVLFIKKRKWIIIFFILVVLLEIAAIYLLLMNKNSYLNDVIGAEQSKSIFYYLFAIEENLNFKGIITQIVFTLTDIKKLSYLGAATLLIFIITISHFITNQYNKSIYKTALFFAIVFFLLYIPQFILYLKININLRYYIPISLFYSIFIVYCYSMVNNKNIKYLQLIVISFFSIYLIFQVLNMSLNYKNEGEGLKKLYKVIDERQINNVLILVDPAYDHEGTASIVTYLKQTNTELKFNYYIGLNKGGHSMRSVWENIWQSRHKNKIEKIENIENYKYILIFQSEDRIYKNIALPNYSSEDFSVVTLFTKKQ